MKVGLFVTCLVDLTRPGIGFAALRLLEGAGCEVVVPQSQSCCGQPGYNSGAREIAILEHGWHGLAVDHGVHGVYSSGERGKL